MAFRLITRRRDGRYELRLPGPARDVVADACAGLRALIADDPDDPSLWRLFPDAYPDDPDHAAFYRLVARDQLVGVKAEALALVERTARADVLTEDELEQWMRALNSVRLALGTRLDAGEEAPTVAADDPDAPLWQLYEVLGVLVGSIVEVLAAGLPPEGTGAERAPE
jgi:hypothetical protein